MIGVSEIIMISAVILILFGGKKIPELMKGVGKGVKSFKEGLSEPSEEEMNRRINEEMERRIEEIKRERLLHSNSPLLEKEEGDGE